MVELRLDYAHEVDVAGVLDDRRCPVVVACRPSWEGGHFAGSEEERRRLLALALKLGAEHVDLEWRAGFEELISSDTADGSCCRPTTLTASPMISTPVLARCGRPELRWSRSRRRSRRCRIW